MEFNFYVCVDHDGYWPVGACSIVYARDVEQARELLDKQLIERKLKPYAEKPYTLQQIALKEAPFAQVLLDGDY